MSRTTQRGSYGHYYDHCDCYCDCYCDCDCDCYYYCYCCYYCYCYNRSFLRYLQQPQNALPIGSVKPLAHLVKDQQSGPRTERCTEQQ